jgi:nitrogenase molybdenum-iron protein NifN
MPMGASLAFKGIKDSMVIIHGSQGCSTYIRRHISTHYNEPIDIASSSLSEEGTVYGGASNLILGVKNVAKSYSPKVIGILTSCLAETIGEDTNHIIKSSDLDKELPGIDFVSVKTPGYGGSQYKGYYAALRSLVEYYSKSSGVSNGKINIIVTDLSSADVRELKRILGMFDVDYIMFPDISETVDAPFIKDFNKIPSGGTSQEEMISMGDSMATIELGVMIPEQLSAGKYLEQQFGVPLVNCPVPIGLEAMDAFVEAIKEISHTEIPSELIIERGRMLDAMIDSHKFNSEGRAIVYGNPELIFSVSSLCIENGVKPVAIATGSDERKLKEVIGFKLNKFHYTSKILDDTDFETIGRLVASENANILIGNSDGKFVKEHMKIPLVRTGFPIHDQVGGQRRLNIGYEGSLRLLDEITNTILDTVHETFRTEMYDNYYTEAKKYS